MTPIEFISTIGDNISNTPPYEIAEALSKDIIIRGCFNEYEILSYYYDPTQGCMTLDIQHKGQK